MIVGESREWNHDVRLLNTLLMENISICHMNLSLSPFTRLSFVLDNCTMPDLWYSTHDVSKMSRTHSKKKMVSHHKDLKTRLL